MTKKIYGSHWDCKVKPFHCDKVNRWISKQLDEKLRVSFVYASDVEQMKK